MPDVPPLITPLWEFLMAFLIGLFLIRVTSLIIAWGSPVVAGGWVVHQLTEDPSQSTDELLLRIVVAGGLAAIVTAHTLPMLAKPPESPKN